MDIGLERDVHSGGSTPASDAAAHHGAKLPAATNKGSRAAEEAHGPAERIDTMAESDSEKAEEGVSFGASDQGRMQKTPAPNTALAPEAAPRAATLAETIAKAATPPRTAVHHGALAADDGAAEESGEGAAADVPKKKGKNRGRKKPRPGHQRHK